MKIFVQSNDSQAKIQIDLIDNPPIARWFNQYRQLEPITGQLTFSTTANLATYPVGNESELYNQLLTTISTLQYLLKEKSVLEITWPQIPVKFNRDQHWCNHIHNVFVTVSIFLENNCTDYWQVSDTWSGRMFLAAKELNILIHKLEKWANTTANNLYVSSYNHQSLQTRFDDSHGLGLWFEISQHEQELYHSTLKNNLFYNVVFSNEILGKTYYRSFIDEESVDSPAISGIDKTWGNLDIKLDSQRELIFHSPQFQTWIDLVTEDKANAPLEFPVGTINPLSDLDYFVKRKATEVTFHFVY